MSKIITGSDVEQAASNMVDALRWVKDNKRIYSTHVLHFNSIGPDSWLIEPIEYPITAIGFKDDNNLSYCKFLSKTNGKSYRFFAEFGELGVVNIYMRCKGRIIATNERYPTEEFFLPKVYEKMVSVCRLT